MGIASARERIIETAENLFAENGFDSTTLRELTEEAKVNLASVNYHFGSKEGLSRELMERRIPSLCIFWDEHFWSCRD